MVGERAVTPAVRHLLPGRRRTQQLSGAGQTHALQVDGGRGLGPVAEHAEGERVAARLQVGHGVRQRVALLLHDPRGVGGEVVQQVVGLVRLVAAQGVPGARQAGERHQRARGEALLPLHPFLRGVLVAAGRLERLDRRERRIVRERSAGGSIGGGCEPGGGTGPVAAVPAQARRQEARRHALVLVEVPAHDALELLLERLEPGLTGRRVESGDGLVAGPEFAPRGRGVGRGVGSPRLGGGVLAGAGRGRRREHRDADQDRDRTDGAPDAHLSGFSAVGTRGTVPCGPPVEIATTRDGPLTTRPTSSFTTRR